MIPRILRAGRPAVLVGGALLALAGCASNAPLDTLKPQGPISRSIDSLSDPIFLIAGIVFVLIFGASGLIWWKFRDDHSTDEFPPQVHGHFRAEIAWTIGPAILMAAIGVFTLVSHFELNSEDRTDIVLNVDGVSTSWDPEIVVVGQQWWWEFRYYFDGLDGLDLSDPRHLPPADIVSANQMVIPTGSEIGLSVTSRDVIHSFWIPALNGKRDAVPRRISPWKIEADVPGFYFGQCTEFCGLSHSRMRMQAVAMAPADFQAWVDEQMQPAAEPTGAAAQRGLAVFEGQCTRRCQRSQRRPAQQGRRPGGQRRSEPDPPDEPYHLRRRDLRSLRAGRIAESHTTRGLVAKFARREARLCGGTSRHAGDGPQRGPDR